ncbi:MAG: 4-hydroxy-tetrahydrodipicolinate synthase [Candidatus Ancaeobacter aquaticus]|nr:4-hydroxy-tetrahydrodipicolinate synthase [Candidatus Ancaeobacter aquaticus]
MFKGSIVALVTPFKDSQVDYTKIEELVEMHVSSGTHGIVPCGTTGEAPTLDFEEHIKVIETTVKAVNKRVPVIAGTGSNSTAETVYLTEQAKKVGADAVLISTPYYNKPPQKGLYEHYKKVNDSVDIPIVLYNVPGRTAVSFTTETVTRLAELKNVVALKEASGSVDTTSQIIAQSDITVLSGDDSLTLPLISVGAKGVISVTANVAPKEMSALVEAALKGDYDTARKMHYSLMSLFKVLFVESNPIPVKAALELMGKISGDLRLPLCRIDDANKEKVKKVLQECSLV